MQNVLKPRVSSACRERLLALGELSVRFAQGAAEAGSRSTHTHSEYSLTLAENFARLSEMHLVKGKILAGQIAAATYFGALAFIDVFGRRCTSPTGEKYPPMGKQAHSQERSHLSLVCSGKSDAWT